jgi:hypothetical protein
MRFENCIYDNLQLADRFLVCAERLLRRASKAEAEKSMVFLHFEGGAEFFGFYSILDLVLWKIKYSHIYKDDEATFTYLLDGGRGFIATAYVVPGFVFEIAKHYIGVAERLMNMEEK